MAITILKAPATHTPAYNNQYFTLSSTNSAQANFRYVMFLTVDGITTIHRVAPRPSDGKGVINAGQKKAESYVQNTFNSGVVDATPATMSIKKVTAVFQEEYGTPPTLQGLTVTTDYYVWNAAYDVYEFLSYSFSASGLGKILNQDFNQLLIPAVNILRDQSFFSYWHRAFSANNFVNLRVRSFDQFNNLLQDALLPNAYAVVGANYDRNLLYFNGSPNGLEAWYTASPGSKSVPADLVVPVASAYYYLFWEKTGPVATVSETYQVNILDYCSSYPKYTVHFLNRYGAFDPQVFSLKPKTTVTKRENRFKKTPYKLNNSDEYTYTSESAVDISYSIVTGKAIELNTDILTTAQYEALQDLITSPTIMLEDSDGNFYSMKCENNNYESRTQHSDKCFNLQVTLKYALDSVRQTGIHTADRV